MSGLSKWAKYGVLAMIAADGVGVMVVHNRLNRPVANVPSIANDQTMAMIDTASALPKVALLSDNLDKDNVQVSDTVAQMNVQTLPAVARMDPLPAPMRVEPLALDTPQASPRVAREMREALRAPVIPTVRIAELRSEHRATHAFSSAFTNDISSSTQAGSAESDVGYSRVPTSRDSDQQSSEGYDTARPELSSPPSEIVEAPVQARSDLPVPEFGRKSEPQQLQLDLPAPAAPEASAPDNGEIPAS